jgi:hypothetical protein
MVGLVSGGVVLPVLVAAIVKLRRHRMAKARVLRRLYQIA